MSFGISPMATTNAAGSFTVSTEGYIQGTFLDDPAMRYQLEGGQVASSQSTPLWGGLPIQLKVPQIGAKAQGPQIIAATAIANIEAWALFNQASGMFVTGSSAVPVAAAGMSLNFARPGSLLRIAVPIDPSIVDSVVGGSPQQQVQWDFTNNRIEAYTSGTALPVLIEDIDLNSELVAYNTSTGVGSWTIGAIAIIRI